MNLEKINSLTEEEIEYIMSNVLLTNVLQCTKQGMPGNKAMRVVVVGYLQKYFGSKVWNEIGVPVPTVERWRREYREVLHGEDIPDSITPGILEIVDRMNEGRS